MYAHSHIKSSNRQIIKSKGRLVHTDKWQLMVNISSHLSTSNNIVQIWIHRYRTFEQIIPSTLVTAYRTFSKQETAIQLWHEDKSVLNNRDIPLKTKDQRCSLKLIDALRSKSTILPVKIHSTLHTSCGKTILIEIIKTEIRKRTQCINSLVIILRGRYIV